MNTQDIWDNFNEELYFFILKKVNSKHVANDIFQNSFAESEIMYLYTLVVLAILNILISNQVIQEYIII